MERMKVVQSFSIHNVCIFSGCMHVMYIPYIPFVIHRFTNSKDGWSQEKTV